MPVLLQFLLWSLVGGGAVCIHLWLLHRSIEGTRNLAPHQARLRITSGFSIRLLVMLPILFLVARGGLAASLGFLLGYLLGRVVIVRYRERQHPVQVGEGQD